MARQLDEREGPHLLQSPVCDVITRPFIEQTLRERKWTSRAEVNFRRDYLNGKFILITVSISISISIWKQASSIRVSSRGSSFSASCSRSRSRSFSCSWEPISGANLAESSERAKVELKMIDSLTFDSKQVNKETEAKSVLIQVSSAPVNRAVSREEPALAQIDCIVVVLVAV